MQLLVTNRSKIIDLFDDIEIDRLTDEQLRIQKNILDQKLGFPSFESGKLTFDYSAKCNIADIINNNPFLRSKLSCVINNYERKLKDLEDTGNPINLCEQDIKSTVLFSSSSADEANFVSVEVIGILKNAGAVIC